jgi:threonine dehydratase
MDAPANHQNTNADNVRLTHRLKLSAIEGAAKKIDPVFLNTPQYECEPLSQALGCSLTLKIEFANPIRCFKGRGSSCLIHRLKETAPGNVKTLVSASAGNWGQALAYSCRAAGFKLVLFASVHANPLKVTRMRALGAEVIQHGQDFDAAKEEAERFADAHGFLFVVDGLNQEIAEGAGTIAVELLNSGAVFDAMTVPLGNGALLTGMARWVKANSPPTHMLGVSSEGADAMEKSWRLGTRFEAAGAAGVAAILADKNRFAGQRVATVLCGSNLNPTQVESWPVR